MTPGTEFTILHHSALGTMLGIRPSVVSSPAADARTYVHPRLGETDIVVLSPKKTPDGPYSFHKEADNAVSMALGFDIIYIYTDVVEYRIVSVSFAPLLRSLLVSGTHCATVSHSFTNIHYVSLLYAHFRSFEINIRDDIRRLVPFEHGKVTVTLHFRRRRTGLF